MHPCIHTEPSIRHSVIIFKSKFSKKLIEFAAHILIVKWQLGKQHKRAKTFSKDLQARIEANTGIKSKVYFFVGPNLLF